MFLHELGLHPPLEFELQSDLFLFKNQTLAGHMLKSH
jgi:hypothetical protein